MNIRCLLGRHDFVGVPMEVCSHLRHCSRCDRAYTGLAKMWSRDRRRNGRPWLAVWLRAFVLRDPSWECPRNSVWRELAWPTDFGA